VEHLKAGPVPEKNKLLRDQFVDNIHELQLRRDTKHWVRDHPHATFQRVREEVQGWLDEDITPVRRIHVREVEVDEPQACSEVKSATDYHKVIADLNCVAKATRSPCQTFTPDGMEHACKIHT
jgi:hypothetical protein